jgi:O-antigen/teichoic acid export membrane protein
MLTVMGIVNAVGTSLGNPLNNTRILLQPEYNKKNLNGVFIIIFLFCLPLNFFIVLSLSWIIYSGISFDVVGSVIITGLVLFRSYFSASYRIIIDYKKVLYSNVWGFFGYIVGLIITFLSSEWVFSFIFGELFSCIYIFFTAHILHDKFRKTPLFNRSLKKFLLIMSAAVISMTITYMDRFIIYPLLGAEQVSIYNVASFMGKTAGLFMGPIAGVLLTYYAKEVELSVKQFYIRMSLLAGASMILFILIILIGIPVTRFLYPTLIGKASKYFIIANLGSILFILGNTMMPTLLKFCSSKWLPVIQVVSVLLYLVFGYYGMMHYHLLGLCYSILIVNIIKIIIMLLIATFTLYNNEDKVLSRNSN